MHRIPLKIGHCTRNALQGFQFTGCNRVGLKYGPQSVRNDDCGDVCTRLREATPMPNENFENNTERYVTIDSHKFIIELEYNLNV